MTSARQFRSVDATIFTGRLTGRLRRSLEMSDLRPSSHIDAPKEEVQLPGSVHHHLDEFPTSDRTDDVDAAGAEGDIDDAEWEVPRSLQLPNHEVCLEESRDSDEVQPTDASGLCPTCRIAALHA